MNQYIREPINTLTHLAGAVLAIFGLLAMLLKAVESAKSAAAIVAVVFFGLSMILLYSASTAYHMAIAKESVIRFLRKIDHSMIYVLIAGTYAPFCLITLEGVVGWSVFIVIMIAALAGILFKMIWFKSPRWLSTAIYISMGWMIILAGGPLMQELAAPGFWLLVAGGILYTVGGIIYGFKPKFLEFKHFGYHEIFHIFILLGSLAHFLSVYYFVL